jgi:hypothetical protein
MPLSNINSGWIEVCILCIVFDLVVVSGWVNCCWPSPAQSFLVPGPAGPVTVFFCPTVLESRDWLVNSIVYPERSEAQPTNSSIHRNMPSSVEHVGGSWELGAAIFMPKELRIAVLFYPCCNTWMCIMWWRTSYLPHYGMLRDILSDNRRSMSDVSVNSTGLSEMCCRYLLSARYVCVRAFLFSTLLGPLYRLPFLIRLVVL